MKFYVNCLQVGLCLPLVLVAVSGNNISLLLMFLSLCYLSVSLESGPQTFWNQGLVLWKTMGVEVEDSSSVDTSDGEWHMRLPFLPCSSPPAVQPSS